MSYPWHIPAGELQDPQNTFQTLSSALDFTLSTLMSRFFAGGFIDKSKMHNYALDGLLYYHLTLSLLSLFCV